MDSQQTSSSVALAAQTPATASVTRMAIAMAIHLDEIRQTYGDEAANFVAMMLRDSTEAPWEEVVFNALARWTSQHPRFVLDLNL